MEVFVQCQPLALLGMLPICGSSGSWKAQTSHAAGKQRMKGMESLQWTVFSWDWEIKGHL